LATVSVLAYGNWQKNIKETQIKSDLTGAKTAMENWKSFHGSYPTSINDITSFKPSSSNVVITGGSSDGSTYKLYGSANGSVGYVIMQNSDPILASGMERVSIYNYHGCFVNYADKAYCWGINDQGQLGDGTYDNKNKPVAVNTSGVLAGKKVTSISAGNSHTCAIADGEAYCWGVNYFGMLGNGTNTRSNVPVKVDVGGVLAGKKVTSVSTGQFSSCAIADGQAYCWGSKTSGSLGDGTDSNITGVYSSNKPVKVDTRNLPPNSTVVSLSTMGGASCIVVSNGKIYCWGMENYNGITNIALLPTEIIFTGDLANKSASYVSVGAGTNCLIAEGKAYCWGGSGWGQLGDGSYSAPYKTSPVAVNANGLLKDKVVTSIASSILHTCAVADGQVYCWGFEARGSFGTNKGSGLNLAPVGIYTDGVLKNKTIKSVSVDQYNSCFISSDSLAFCTGDNPYGQLGNGSLIGSNIPVAVTVPD
jgi:alpha-tubulin suppressor-like RCC1 family protein